MRKYIIIAAILIIILAGFSLKKSNDQTNQTVNNEITIKGSDTEVQMISALAEAFSGTNPDAKISVTGGGSGVGIAALFNKEIDIANSSRQATDDEWNLAKSQNLDLREFIVARDGLVIIANPASPVNTLTLDQLAKIFKGTITNWNEVGGGNNPIVLYGRQTTSGTYSFFREAVIKDDYAPAMRNMEGNQAIFDAIKTDKDGIGYIGVGYVKDENNQPKKEVKILLIAKDANSNPISPLDETAIKQGDYPIFRPIYQYLPKLPQKDSLTDKFLRFETSDAGQKIIKKTGFYSITQEDTLKNQQFFRNIK